MPLIKSGPDLLPVEMPFICWDLLGFCLFCVMQGPVHSLGMRSDLWKGILIRQQKPCDIRGLMIQAKLRHFYHIKARKWDHNLDTGIWNSFCHKGMGYGLRNIHD